MKKNYWLTGLIILLPVALTMMVIFFLFDFFTTPVVDIVDPLIKLMHKKLPYTFPKGLALFLSRLFSLVFLCLFILFLGFITRWFVVKNFMSWGTKVIARIPLVKTIYKVSKDIFSALFSTEGKKAFKRPVMIPFTNHPNFCLGFEAGEVAEECQEKVPEKLISVFAPTAPHPISGFLFLIPEKHVKDIDMSNEAVVKFLVSCGMLVPEEDEKEVL